MNTKLVFRLNGYILLFDAIAMLLPMLVAFVYKESSGFAFIPAVVISLAIGIPLIMLKPKNKSLFAREGLATVAIAWIMMSIIGALPFFFSREIPNLIDCIFETASGFTTTGATILRDVEALSNCMLFWRSFTHWIGGMGVLMFVMAITPLAGGSNMQLIRAESAGPKVEKILPKASRNAMLLYGLYIGLTVIQIAFLLFGKMPFFDAVTTAFATAGTGGFGIKNSGMSEYSTYIQGVVTVFMLLFSVSFNIYFLLVARRFKEALKNEELRVFLLIVAVAIVCVTVNTLSLFGNLFDAIHHSSFTVASIISTAGFSTVDFNLWPEFSKMILVLLMFIGACAGSTGGGIKVARILILIKSLTREFTSLIHPRSIKTININGKKIADESIQHVNAYMMCFVVIFAVSVILISLDNFDFATNVTAVAATLNNVGPGLGMVGPAGNFSEFSWFSKIVLTIDMICGRLELFPIMIILLPQTWKKN